MKKQSFRKKVMEMQVGETLTISADAVGETTIRGYACDLGWRLNRTYRTHRNREARTYTIERIS